MFLVLLLLFWSLLFGLMMFHKYYVAMLGHSCCVHSLWKCQLKSLFHSGDTFRYIFCMLLKESLWILPLRYVVLCLSLVLSVHLLLMFSKDFEIVRVITSVCNSYIKETELLVFIFKFSRVLYRWILTVQDV